MESKGKSHNKIFLILALVVLTVLLSYIFAIMYLFYISPNDIVAKLGVWPLLSDEAVGGYELDAVMQIDFTEKKEFDELEKKTTFGVNVREDGVVIAPANKFTRYDGGQINIVSNSGQVLNGNLLFVEPNYNIAILKCENMQEDSQKISLPYVDLSYENSREENIIIANPLTEKNVWLGKITEEFYTLYGTMDVEGSLAVNTVLEDSQSLVLNDGTEGFEGGAVFDRYGFLMGLSFGGAIGENGDEFLLMSIQPVKMFLSDVLSAYSRGESYSNTLANSVVGFDFYEINCHILASNQTEEGGKEGSFFFDGQWQEYSDEILNFADNISNSVGGYYLFKDFVYGQNSIEAGNVLTSIAFGSEFHTISSKLDLFDCIYRIKSGDRVKFTYANLQSKESGELLFVV